MKKSLCALALSLTVALLCGHRLAACTYSGFTVDSVKPDPGGMLLYRVYLTFCAGTGLGGASADTRDWEIMAYRGEFEEIPISSYWSGPGFPATLTSPATGDVFNAVQMAPNRLRYVPATPTGKWTCTSSGCGPASSACISFSVAIRFLPGEITLLGAEGNGSIVGSCMDAGMTATIDPACSTSTLAQSVTVTDGCGWSYLDATVTGGFLLPGYNYEHMWYTAISPTTTEDLTIFGSGSIYRVSWDNLGCATPITPFAYSPPPTLYANAGPDKQIYIGYGSTCATLGGTASFGTPPYSYLWSNGSTSPSPSVCPTTTTVYSLTVTDAAGCTATDAATVTVTNVSCGGGKVKVCHAGTTKCYTTSQVPTHLAHGDYLGACTAKADGSEFIQEQSLTVAPVPAQGQVSLALTAGEDGACTLEVMDLQGRTVTSLQPGWMAAGEEREVLLDVSAFAPGIYLVRFAGEAGECIVKKLIVAH